MRRTWSVKRKIRNAKVCIRCAEMDRGANFQRKEYVTSIGVEVRILCKTTPNFHDQSARSGGGGKTSCECILMYKRFVDEDARRYKTLDILHERRNVMFATLLARDEHGAGYPDQDLIFYHHIDKTCFGAI